MIKFMYYLYVIYSETFNQWYIGYSSDLRKRIKQHNTGQVQSTKAFAPWTLMYYEAYAAKALAQDREQKLKHHGRGFKELKKRIVLQ
jgi:putative endonuclease